MIFLSYFLFGDFISQAPTLYIVIQFSLPLWTYPLNPVNGQTLSQPGLIKSMVIPLSKADFLATSRGPEGTSGPQRPIP